MNSPVEAFQLKQIQREKERKLVSETDEKRGKETKRKMKREKVDLDRAYTQSQNSETLLVENQLILLLARGDTVNRVDPTSLLAYLKQCVSTSVSGKSCHNIEWQISSLDIFLLPSPHTKAILGKLSSQGFSKAFAHFISTRQSSWNKTL